jgi:hypothetical protein
MRADSGPAGGFAKGMCSFFWLFNPVDLFDGKSRDL